MYQRIAPGFEADFSAEDVGFSSEAYRLGLEYINLPLKMFVVGTLVLILFV